MAIRILNNCYKNKKLNPEIVWRLINENIDEKNEVYNAFINRCDKSIEMAKESRKRFDKNASIGVLDGVPVVVKDNYCISDQYTTCGSAMLKNFKPQYTASLVTRLLKAGAIIVGKTNMDEFAMGSGSKDSNFGEIINPWISNDGSLCVTGGSSGGTAVAVAAGWALAGLGTDTGGSIRLPATLTGLVGLKPTYGVLSRHGVIALMNALDTPSIMTRFIEDAQLVFSILKGKDLRDPTLIEYPETVTDKEPFDIKKIRIGIPEEFYPEGMLEDIVQLWDDTAVYMSSLGCQVVRVKLPHVSMAGKCYSVLCCAEVASNMARYDGIEYGYRKFEDDKDFFDTTVAKSRSHSLGAAVKERILMGNFFLLRNNRKEYFDQARKIWQLICDDFTEVFKKVDVILCPAAMEDAPAVKNFTLIDNRVAMIKGDICTQPSSLAGIPSITIPGRLSNRGMPIGVQLMAPKFREDLLFDVGKVIEKWANFHHKFQFVHERALNELDQ